MLCLSCCCCLFLFFFPTVFCGRWKSFLQAVRQDIRSLRCSRSARTCRARRRFSMWTVQEIIFEQLSSAGALGEWARYVRICHRVFVPSQLRNQIVRGGGWGTLIRTKGDERKEEKKKGSVSNGGEKNQKKTRTFDLRGRKEPLSIEDPEIFVEIGKTCMKYAKRSCSRQQQVGRELDHVSEALLSCRVMHVFALISIQYPHRFRWQFQDPLSIGFPFGPAWNTSLHRSGFQLL